MERSAAVLAAPAAFVIAVSGDAFTFPIQRAAGRRGGDEGLVPLDAIPRNLGGNRGGFRETGGIAVPRERSASLKLLRSARQATSVRLPTFIQA